MKINVNIKKLDERAILPTYGSDDAAGADLYACMDSEITIKAGETQMIGTKICIEIPSGYAGFLFARSGLASKKGLAPANKVGVIDSDYRGEIIVALHNHSSEDKIIASNERIAQMVFMPYNPAIFNIVDELDETKRGTGGFGSTGK